MEQPRVSLSMIVKDEIKVLGKCLDSVEKMVDEIVIVDTGSKDGTWELVQERADRYDQIKWTGFADARNRSLELCTGKYILILDADETWLEGPVDEMVKALEQGAHAAALQVENQLPEGQLLVADRIWQIRMWKNDPAIRWYGKVHNQVASSIEELAKPDEMKVAQVPCRIHHIGYSYTPEELKEKYKTRLKHLHDERRLAKDAKHKAYYEFQLSNAYFMLREYDKALDWAEKCDIEKLTHENLMSLALMSVHTSHVTTNDKDKARHWSRIMFKIRPDEPITYLMNGLTNLGVNNKAAYMQLGAAIAMSGIPEMSYKYQIDVPFVAGAAGEAALALRRLGEAKELFAIHLSKYETPHIKDLDSKIIRQNKNPLIVPLQEGQVNGEQELIPGLSIRDLRKTD